VTVLHSLVQEQAMSREDTRPLAASVCLAVNVVHKAFVAHAAELSSLREWRALWLSTLQGLKMCATTTDAAAADVRAAVEHAMAAMMQARAALASDGRYMLACTCAAHW
jgi:hypothetical protein